MGKGKKGKQQSGPSQGDPASSDGQQPARAQQPSQPEQSSVGRGQSGQQYHSGSVGRGQPGQQHPSGSVGRGQPGQQYHSGSVGRGQSGQQYHSGSVGRGQHDGQQSSHGRGQPPQSGPYQGQPPQEVQFSSQQQQKGPQQGQQQQKGPQQGQQQQKGPQQGQQQQKGPHQGQQQQKGSHQGQQQQKGPHQGQQQQKGSQQGQPPQGVQFPSQQQQKGPQQGQQQQIGLQQGQPLLAQQPQPSGEDKSQKPSSHSGDSQGKKDKPTAKPQKDKENQPPKKIDSGPLPMSKKSPSHQPLFPIPHRKGVGTLGRRTQVEVNQLPLNLSKLCPEIYHYDVAVDPDKPKRFLRPIVAEFIKRHCNGFNPAFDGKKNLYAARQLPFGTSKSDQITMTNEERVSNNELEFQITVKLAQKINTSTITAFLNSRTTGQRLDVPQTAIQAIDVALRAAPLVSGPVPVGRSYFIPPDGRERIIELGGGLELWYGFYQSAILNWKPFLNVDVAHKGFPIPTNLVEIFCQVCRLNNPRDNFRPDDVLKFRGFVTTLKCDYEIPNTPNSRRTYRINNVGKSPANLRFRPDNGPEISVVDYFKRVKNYQIKHPDLPTVQVDPPAKNIFLPIELCYLKPGQALNRKLDEEQTAAMVKAAAKPPEDRKRRILNAIRTAQYNRSPVVKEFGIEVNENLDKVDARILDPPGVQYRNQSNPRPQPGQWRAGEFMLSHELSKWFIMCLDFRTRREKLNDFARMLASQGRNLGMTIQNVTEIKEMDTRSRQIKADVTNVLHKWKAQGAELVVVVIPGHGDFYSMVKRCAELEVGVLTQCIKANTMFKMNPATCGNILLKVNSKTNGKNHQLGDRYKPGVLSRPVMLIGIDVTHPSPDQTSIPSVAAVAASHDATAFQYNMIWRLQNPREEIVVDLKNIIIEQLKFFFTKTRYKPEKIIVYRDGVSEGQFQQVLAAELNAIRQACTTLEKDYKPGITFLVVQKRHHVRFFPMKSQDEDGKNRNVPPGTIVDTTITHPRELDFYLVSHSSLQGTSRPTKYHRLWDDNNISEDELEVLTYYLCYLFSRCTRSVSYPAPTYYAHLAAFRARTYLENNPAPLNNLEGFASKNKIEPVFMKNTPMFFV
nr:PREDICTED: protein argonaute-3-like [Bemisia tabaci]